MIRLFVPDPLFAGAAITPSPEQARYLLGVMRLKPGAALSLFNGRDGEWRAAIESAGRRDSVLRVGALTRPLTFPPDLELVVALVKRGPLETIVEKATELGVRRVRLAVTRRTNSDHTRVERLRAIAIEAAEQTGRLEVPEVIEPLKLEALLAAWPAERRLMFCDEAGDDPEEEWGGVEGRAPPALKGLTPGAGRWAVLIGPEGGFAPEERAALRELPFVTAVSLGPRILRADTAAIAALTLWQAAVGDWT
jgi:16S rRNA (uracil1498-N3)-methyltransferase